MGRSWVRCPQHACAAEPPARPTCCPAGYKKNSSGGCTKVYTLEWPPGGQTCSAGSGGTCGAPGDYFTVTKTFGIAGSLTMLTLFVAADQDCGGSSPSVRTDVANGEPGGKDRRWMAPWAASKRRCNHACFSVDELLTCCVCVRHQRRGTRCGARAVHPTRVQTV